MTPRVLSGKRLEAGRLEPRGPYDVAAAEDVET